jgi:superfamily II DNA/RNA helicase
VVIGTAKRLNQIYSLYALNLTGLKIFAIDDADQVIKSINYLQIDRLAESIPKAQKIVFTTQMTDWISRFSAEFTNVEDVIDFEDDEPIKSE